MNMQGSDPKLPPNNDGKQTNEAPVEFYRKRERIYPRAVSGIFAKLRVLGVLTLLGIFYGLPWLTWDDRQAVLLDLPARKFYIFGFTFWPQDFFFLAVLLIIAALSLFFFTALAGRLWCGYACPQTVWTEVFLWIERQIEGDRPKAMKLDKAPMSARKLRIKATKHAVWIAFSLFTGFTFVGYFSPLDSLWQGMLSFSLGPWETFWIFFYGFATYGNAGWMREQVCLYMCPYARFQSAMFDRNTLIISYDEHRGEPRGSRKKGTDPRAAGLGDCVNCTLCVQVCPTGIDIRDGLQYQCIGCAACIDVCDEVMEKVGYPKGLIKYTTQNAMDGKPANVLRPRTIIYALLLLGLTVGLLVAVATRVPLELDIIRDRVALYTTTDDGLVENIYTLKLLNMDDDDHAYDIRIEGLKDAELLGAEDVFVPAGSVQDLVVSIQVDPYSLDRPSNEIQFHIVALDNPDLQRTESARFLGPVAP
jgi:cytochrome c oxidase accessory protein FixG